MASSGKAICPVALMNCYLGRAGLPCDSRLFYQLAKNKCGYKPWAKGLSYSQLRDLVLEAIKGITPDTSAIGRHSLRKGGTTAAANAGLPDRLYKRHGPLASKSAKDGYVQGSLPSHLAVSMALVIQFPHTHRLFYSRIYLVGRTRGTVVYGHSWPGVFLLGASGGTGRFFTQPLFHDSISVSL